MQLDYLVVHIVILVVSLWIVKLGIEGIIHRRLEIRTLGYEREYLSATALLLSLSYVVFGVTATLMTLLSFSQTDYRLLQLVLVILVLWLMTNIIANWFTQAP